jgi:molecular chaperone GrpE (heat shock protein)
MNFEDELNKLLFLETEMIPKYEATELAAAGLELLADLDKKQTDISLQIEEIYDLVKEQDIQALQKVIETENTRANQLVAAAAALSDLLEDFCTYAAHSGSEELKHQANLLWEHSGSILGGCGIIRFGAIGESLNPQIHTVKAGVESPFPLEQVVQVLQSGYAYQGAVLKKAAVVVSRGQDAKTGEYPLHAESENAGNRDYSAGETGEYTLHAESENAGTRDYSADETGEYPLHSETEDAGNRDYGAGETGEYPLHAEPENAGIKNYGADETGAYQLHTETEDAGIRNMGGGEYQEIKHQMSDDQNSIKGEQDKWDE